MIQITIKADQIVEGELKRAGSEMGAAFNKVVQKIAQMVRANAIRGISRGKKTGRTYEKRGIKHTASAPGEYPATDTGRLANSIRVDVAHLEVSVGSDVGYAAFLEDGTSRIQARPWLEPSYIAVEPQINTMIDEALIKVFGE